MLDVVVRKKGARKREERSSSWTTLSLVSIGLIDQVLSAADSTGLLFAHKVRDKVKLVLAQEEFRQLLDPV